MMGTVMTIDEIRTQIEQDRARLQDIGRHL
jgi:hypothetical protein